ncbi:MAG TPA: hypothetical protein VJP78_16165 [Thermoleophilia bacterium]|nr:hypothetical protein [Thermoleophilia bacterium]
MLEVLAAMALLAILVGPLAMGVIAILDRGDVAERQADDLGSRDLAGVGAWGWGDQVLGLVWSPGPSLTVRAVVAGVGSEADDGSEIVLGFWADGWLIAEANPEDDGSVTLGGSTWLDRDGQELVVRARQADGVWGPPRRTLVPDASGRVEMGGEGMSADAGRGEAVVHAPFAANPEVLMISGGGEVVPGLSGYPFFATSLSDVPAGIELGGAEQSWLSQSQRSLDVYF